MCVVFGVHCLSEFVFENVFGVTCFNDVNVHTKKVCSFFFSDHAEKKERLQKTAEFI